MRSCTLSSNQQGRGLAIERLECQIAGQDTDCQTRQQKRAVLPVFLRRQKNTRRKNPDRAAQAIRLHGFRRDALQFLPQKRRAGGENKPAVWFHTVFRIVPAELAVMDDAAQITELVAVRLGAANQKCDAAPPKLRAVPL